MQRILVVDDHLMFGTSLGFMLSQYETEMEVLPVGGVHEALEELARFSSYDLVLLDYAMPVMNGIAGMETIKNLYPDMNIGFVSAYSNPQLVRKALNAGASGWVLKTSKGESLIHFIKLMLDGQRSVPAEIIEEIYVRNSASSIFSKSELTVAELVADGFSNKEIAAKLEIEPRTVETHVRNLFKKSGVDNRVKFSNKFRECY